MHNVGIGTGVLLKNKWRNVLLQFYFSVTITYLDSSVARRGGENDVALRTWCRLQILLHLRQLPIANLNGSCHWLIVFKPEYVTVGTHRNTDDCRSCFAAGVDLLATGVKQFKSGIDGTGRKADFTETGWKRLQISMDERSSTDFDCVSTLSRLMAS